MPLSFESMMKSERLHRRASNRNTITDNIFHSRVNRDTFFSSTVTTEYSACNTTEITSTHDLRSPSISKTIGISEIILIYEHRTNF